MTVKELIKELQKCSKNAKVIVGCYSESSYYCEDAYNVENNNEYVVIDGC